MDDSYANPMRTGLMFVALGPMASPGLPSAPQDRDHLTELRADMDLGASETTRSPSTEGRWSVRRLLGRIGDIARRRGLVPT